MTPALAADPAVATEGEGSPSRLAWVTVGIFWLSMTVASLDRQVIAITAHAIQGDLHLTDTQLGFIQGPAFAFCAAAAGLPVGWLLDRRNRVAVAATCFAIWSATTSMIGLASSFSTLAVARSGGAIGEAGLAPAALSIFADLFPVRRIPRASALFLTAPFIGAGLGLFVGGVLLDGFTRALPTLPPLLRGFHSWQLVFLTVGCPGVVLAIVLKLAVRDLMLITAKPEVATPAKILADVAASTDAGQTLLGFNPSHTGYLRLRAKLAELRQTRVP
uniref:MFS transporter n=1 Tax=Sphingomonas bacterium TaxID=1895847 RepID=UPI0015765BC9